MSESMMIFGDLFQDLPEGWIATDFGNAVDYQEGPGILAKDFHEDGIPLIRLKGIQEPTVSLNGANYLSPEKVREKWNHFRLRVGDLLLSSSASLGRVSEVGNTASGAVAYTGIIRLRPKDDSVTKGFIKYFAQSPIFFEQIRRFAGGSVINHFGPTHLKQMGITLPPVNEQKAIAHILGTLDDKIELNRKTNETLEGIAKALFKSWFVDFDPVRAKAEGRPTGLPDEISELFPDSFEESELGEIPSGWKVDEIGNVVECVGGSTPSTKESEYWDEGMNYWATPKDLSDLSEPFLLDTAKKITDLGVTKISSGILPMGTVLLSSRAPVGYVAVAKVPVSVNQGFIAMKPSALLPTNFLLNWTLANVQQFKDRASGTTFAEISKKAFRPVPVLLPRSGVVNAFTEIVEPLYENVVLNMKQSGSLTALRDALLPRLISGELRVPDAEKMLEEVGI